MTNILLPAGVCLFTALAAICWLRSATVKIPNITENLAWSGTGKFPDALRAQAKWNTCGAWAASAAAFLQTMAFALPLIISN